MIGVSKITCTNNTAPASALSLKGFDNSWVISGDSVYYDGHKVYIFHKIIWILCFLFLATMFFNH